MNNEVKQNSLKAWLLAARPKTLSGAAVPVLIGIALAYTDISREFGAECFNCVPAVLCLLFAFVMQINANFINDFFDYASGNDDTERRLGPLRACTQGWVSIDAMKRAIALTTVIACVVGLPLIWYGGLEMVLVGALCIVFCFLYTTHLSYLGLGDVLVLVFFGIVPVCITYYVIYCSVQATFVPIDYKPHYCTWQVFLASVACGLVVDGLLVVNNYRDRENDREDGKMTLVVRLGAQNSRRLYLALGLVACALGVVFWMNGHLLAFVLPVLYLVLHVYTWLKIKGAKSMNRETRAEWGATLNACLGETARNILIYGLCVVVGLLL
mgnify:CR=1 FL=1